MVGSPGLQVNDVLGGGRTITNVEIDERVNTQGMCFFVTSDEADTTAPYVAGHRPLANQTNVAVDTFISIHIPETMRTETLVNAFGIVLAQLSGTMQAHVDGGIMLAMQMGFSARNAIVAIDMAERGLKAPSSVLEGEFGYFRLFEGDYDLAPCIDSLGKAWRIDEIAHKPFPSGRATHGVLDGLLTLKKEHSFSPEEVDRVVCRVPPLTAQLVGRPILDVMETNYARLSAPYVLASALLNNGVTIKDFGPEALSQERRLALGRRITVESDDNPDKNALTPVTVQILMKQGAVHQTSLDVVYGNPKRPMTREAHLAKFCQNWSIAARHIPDSQADNLVESVDNLESVSDVSNLVDDMVP
jgi:2-methylcitrate dehydratase PrpD